MILLTKIEGHTAMISICRYSSIYMLIGIKMLRFTSLFTYLPDLILLNLSLECLAWNIEDFCSLCNVAGSLCEGTLNYFSFVAVYSLIE